MGRKTKIALVVVTLLVFIITPSAIIGAEWSESVGLLPGSAIIFAANSPSSDIIMANLMKVFYGDRIGICDGTADQAEINTALNLGEYHVVLQTGDYFINSSISMGSGDWLSGQGYGTEIWIPSDFNDNLYMVVINNSVYSTVSDLQFNGNKANQERGQQSAIYLKDNASHTKIINNYIKYMRTDGVYVEVNDTPYDVEISGNIINHIGDDGIDINAIQYSFITNNYFQDCGDNGIDTDLIKHSTISDNVFKSPIGGAGIELEDDNGTGYSEYNTVSGNRIEGATGTAGIYISEGRCNTITGNVISDCVYGVYITYLSRLSQSANNIISDNVIDGSVNSAIYEDSYGNFNLITNNIVTDSGGTPIVISGPDTIEHGNIVN
ncbi:MAG: right-handed parallel beta-helix repeat-containing protein [Dehalococcoidales bacterium]|nr:right-handed parallel beta-helix repeat-containing protein [Dehalococcoidales bacterium]